MLRRLVVLSALVALGCSHGQLDLTDATGSPSGSPTPTTTPPDDFGNGQDGDLDVSNGNQTINDCVVVISASKATVELDQTAFEDGRVILLHQVQDDLGVSSGDGATLTSVGDAGLWELRRISSVAGTTVTLDQDLEHSYSSGAGRAAQACSVPEYVDVNFGNDTSIRAAQWDGQTGGIVAFYAQGSVRLFGDEAGIDASGRGFRGGGASALGSDASIVDLDTDADKGGGKGEGLDPSGFGVNGRGNVGNGGGGGNALMAGGGGGSYIGAGGAGGKQSATVADEPDTAGMPGAQVDVTGRLLFGGGGGGGHNGSSVPGSGGDGGGAILIIANTLVGGANVQASGRNGGDGGDGVSSDGAGGGGAGGTVLLYAADLGDYAGRLEVRGGDGGNVSGPAGDADRCGPGGGGGGGRIDAPGLPGNSTRVRGGNAGQNINATSQVEWAATDGLDGSANVN